MLEIERKFTVKWFDPDFWGSMPIRITQGYLSSVPERTVRVRTKGIKGFITIKGESDDEGLSRFEWEQEIPLSDAFSLLKLCEPGAIDKLRYEIQVGSRIFEVDKFLGDNEGLIVAEVELSSLDETFERPAWLGEELTGQERYYNAALSRNPFKTWKL
jgi:adenylate cyclase